VSRGTVRDRSAGGVGFGAILLNLKAWKKLCYSGKRNVHPDNIWFTSSCVRRSISNQSIQLVVLVITLGEWEVGMT